MTAVHPPQLRSAPAKDRPPDPAEVLDRPTVVHVVESLGGGVMVAVRDYVRATEDRYRHVVVADVRPGHDTGDFAGVEVVRLGAGQGPVGTWWRLRRTLRAYRPAIVHAHSSWAGVLVRLLPVPREDVRYTPHCYAFERRDVPRVLRSGFYLAERLLAPRTGCVAAVSPREVGLADRLRHGCRVEYVPNVVPRVVPAVTVPAPRSPDRRLDVVAAGRLMPQKDPDWFVRFVRRARRLGVAADFTWLGGGDAEAEGLLREEGVRVTGWLPRAEVLRRMAAADLYVHTAAWEGAPLTLLEAAAHDLPIVGRESEALRSLGLVNLYSSPVEAARWLAATTDPVELRRLAVAQATVLRLTNSADEQRAALLRVYADVEAPVGGTARRRERSARR
ncbi:glycosyltransferase [Actinomycetospora chiangmaiensis]|uniref:glycosyltransferase n=1 Tax=Actinomycetospora chiangmaiensis TaxID=402650 RepID=UPI000372594E|nr:glycosyltransferase [Actinomycetospora chiangmaiensis]